MEEMLNAEKISTLKKENEELKNTIIVLTKLLTQNFTNFDEIIRQIAKNLKIINKNKDRK